MIVDIESAKSFVATHARVLDRHRLDLLLGSGDAEQAGVALEAYRNPGGGYGWGLEPDLRSASSQPGAALLAFELWSELGPNVPTHAAALCDWLQAVSLPDGGLPFALPIADPAGCSPWWLEADHTVSSLQITAAVLARAHPVAAQAPLVAAHPWLRSATRYCLDAIASLREVPAAYVFSYSLQFLDAIVDTEPAAADLMARLVGYLPADGLMPVEGGADGETLRPLDYAPRPDRPIRALLPGSIIDDDLERLAGHQQPDGGWPVDWAISSPAAALEWRGYLTVGAIRLLKAHQHLGEPG
jgi:hypothetical protein